MSRADQVARATLVEIQEAVLDAQARRPGSLYNRLLTPVDDVTIYPLLFGRFRVVIGPCGDQEDGGFNTMLDYDTWEEAHGYAAGLRGSRLESEGRTEP